MTNFSLTPHAAASVQNTKLDIQSLYMHRIVSGPNKNQSIVIDGYGTTEVGLTYVNYWAIYDGDGQDANLVAQAKGMRMNARDWCNFFTIIFENRRFNGSTLQVMGATIGQQGEWAIVGGTGDFAMACGVINRKLHRKVDDGEVLELTIDAFCRTKAQNPGAPTTQPQNPGAATAQPQNPGVATAQPQNPTATTVTKVGPIGRLDQGSPFDITEFTVAPKRLESITIRSTSDTVYSIAFSYINYTTGQMETAGPWGNATGEPHTIQLADNEVVTQISGAYTSKGQQHQYWNGSYYVVTSYYIASIKLETNINKTYGPFGIPSPTGLPQFNYPVQPGSAIVGLFGRADNSYITAIGVHVRSTTPTSKIGLVGGSYGSVRDIKKEPKRLVGIDLGASDFVYNIRFEYTDDMDNTLFSDTLGAPGGNRATIRFEDYEMVTEVSGTFGVNPTNQTQAITSIKFVTNRNNQVKTYGPWGSVNGAAFTIPVPPGSAIVGFFVRAANYLNAIGVYVRPVQD